MIEKDNNLENIWERNYPGFMRRTINIPQMSLYSLFKSSVEINSNKTAIINNGKKFSYADTLREIDQFSAFLYEMGVRKGSSVGILLPNSVQFPVAFFAILKLGATVVPLNILLTEHELRERIRETSSSTLIVMEDIVPRILNILYTDLKKLIIVERESYMTDNVLSTMVRKVSGLIETRNQNENIHYMSEARVVIKALDEEQFDPEKTTAVICFTSGLTSIPKGVILTHMNLVSNAYQMKEWAAPVQKDSLTMISGAPFFHAYGIVHGILLPFLLGAKIVIIGNHDDTLAALTNISKESNVIFSSNPYMHKEMFEAINTREPTIGSVSSLVSSNLSSSDLVETNSSGNKKTEILEGYGLTEASSTISYMPIGYNILKENSAGMPLPNTYVKIVDMKTGKITVPLGETGELIVTGPQIMAGFLNNPTDSARVLKEGWLYTGDIASIDNDGFIYILGRKNDVFLSKGFVVSPADIEKVIMGNKNVEEVAVIGYKKNDIEFIKAFIVVKKGLRVTENEIIMHCNRYLADYKIPNSIEFVEFLPKNALGKIIKKSLRDMVMQQ